MVYRDELGAALARIAELEAALERAKALLAEHAPPEPLDDGTVGPLLARIERERVGRVELRARGSRALGGIVYRLLPDSVELFRPDEIDFVLLELRSLVEVAWEWNGVSFWRRQRFAPPAGESGQ